MKRDADPGGQRAARPEGRAARPLSRGRFGREHLARIGAFLRRRREAAGLSVPQIARLSGVSAGAIRALERGASSPSLQTVVAVVGVLGVTLDQAIAAAARDRRVAVLRGPRSGAEAADAPGEAAGLADAALGVVDLVLEGTALRPVDAEIAGAASFCHVARGTLCADLQSGRRVLLRAGDSFLAQPGRVRAWMSAAAAPARVLCVYDRRSGDRSPNEQPRAQAEGEETKRW